MHVIHIYIMRLSQIVQTFNSWSIKIKWNKKKAGKQYCGLTSKRETRKGFTLFSPCDMIQRDTLCALFFFHFLSNCIILYNTTGFNVNINQFDTNTIKVWKFTWKGVWNSKATITSTSLWSCTADKDSANSLRASFVVWLWLSLSVYALTVLQIWSPTKKGSKVSLISHWENVPPYLKP